MIPDQAEVVIIGGGVVGCSIAYNLSQLGMDDVVVLEKEFLASGSTGRCGAGIRQQWGTEMNCLLARDSMRIFESMAEDLSYEPGIGLKQSGYLILAHSQREVEQFEKNVSLQNSLDIESSLLTPEEAREIVPHLNIEDLEAATFCPSDGHADPFHVTEAYARAAARQGVKILTFTPARRIEKKGAHYLVETPRGTIEAPVLVNAAGGYSQQVAEMIGIELPVFSERHEILVTEKAPPLQDPMVISFREHIYCQQAPHGSFIMGLGPEDEDPSYNHASSWQFLKEMSDSIARLLPPLKELRVIRQWAGLYNITPDAQPILGGVDGYPGYCQALGFSGHGFMISPMVGRAIAQQITGQRPEIDLERLNLDRFQSGDLILEPSVV